MLIFVLAMCFAVAAQRYLQTYAPSNAIIARIRQERPRQLVAVGLIVLSVTLGFCGVVLADSVANGAPGWLNIIVFIAICDAFKFALLAAHTSFRRLFAPVSSTFRRPAVPVA